ncbi:flagellar basal body L-ring protein FlgH [Halarcobacter ebronensis]|uniref:flagellar basal body L-ring protein FlgH n=1 Tax=Halarcobacter ebronensis TaxID=1462615 RepID=UPI001E587CD4|nr:flagellar basal body L-ring protein FlgH [Halarcobacter ebronensis]
MQIKLLFFLFVPLVFIGCVQNPEMEFTKPKEQIPREQPIVQKNKGSLYTVKGPSLFADKKDLQVGDIIQVEIDESLSSNTNNKRETSADRSTDLGAGVVTAGNGGIGKKIASTLNPLTNVGFSQTTANDNKGEVKTKLSEDFATTVSAIIQEVYQNGNYFIKARKEMLIDGQKQSLTLTGVIRPYDITSDNSVTSAQIANMQLLYEKDGEEQDVMHVPWGTRILQLFWPF